MPVRENSITVKRAPDNAPHNYSVRDHAGNIIARVNWIRVGGMSAGFDNGSITLQGAILVEWANAEWNEDSEIDAAGAIISEDE